MADRLVFTTSVVAMPPQDTCAAIINIKKNHMNPKIKRPPFAHVTLLAPFVPYREFDEAATKIREAVKDFEPFEVKIEELKTFKNNKSSTLYFEPVPVHDHNAFHKLYAKVSAAYPACKEAGNSFEAHIGVGYFQGPDHFKVALENQRKYQANWKPVTFMLKEIYILSRVAQETPFEVRRVIPLGSDTTPTFHHPVPL